jgi:transcription antitermination factor NusG
MRTNQGMMVNGKDASKGVTKKWYAVRTRFKCEKMVNEQLHKKQIQSYLPLISRTKRYTRKIKHYHVPLINCYVFVYIDIAEYVKVLETQYVVGFIKFGDAISPIPNEEIDVLKRVTGYFKELEVSDMHLKEGDIVEITVGHLTGVQGLLLGSFNKNEFIIQLSTIGYQLKIVVDRQMLRKPGGQRSVA